MPSRRALGPKAYKRYWDCTRTLIGLIPSNQSFRLGDIVHHRLGSAVLRLLINSAGNYREYGTDALDVYLPVLFGLDNLMKQRWYANEVPNEFRFQFDPKIRAKLKMKLIPHHLEWAEPLIFFSRAELLFIHRRFAHLSHRKLATLFKRAPPHEYTKETRTLLDDVSPQCNSCQVMTQSRIYFMLQCLRISTSITKSFLI